MPEKPTRRAVRLRTGGTAYEVTSPDGLVSWEITLSLGTKADGSRDQRRRRFPTKEAAERWRLDTIAKHRAGESSDAGAMTVADLCDRWLLLKTDRRAPTTIVSYRSLLKHHVLPGLGNVRLDRLTTLRVQSHFDALLAAGHPVPSLSLAHRALGGALRQAVAWGIISRSPAVGVVLPSWRGTHQPIALTADEAGRLLSVTADDPLYGALWHVLLATGVRVGEALALAWADVDLDRGVLHVRRRLTRDERARWIIRAGGKTTTAVRSVALADETVAVLKRHQAVQDLRRLDVRDDWEDAGLVFDRGDGRLLPPDRPRHKLPGACRSAGVPVVSVHELRHSHASLVADIVGQAGLLALQHRLGHRLLAQTMAYTHPDVSGQRDAAERVADAITGALRDKIVTNEAGADLN